jgi:hypothetical protein
MKKNYNIVPWSCIIKLDDDEVLLVGGGVSPAQFLKRTFFYNGEKNEWIIGPTTQNSRLSSKLVHFNIQIIF